MTKCELNQIFLGEVASVQNYGAFVRIPGTSQQGLIHRSQVSTAHVDNVAEVLQKGERVWCKVISVGEDGKIGLSMKHVNQGNGTDLDPNGVELQRDAQRKKNPGTTQHKAIQLEAVLNTTCTKCGTRGHLSKDCFMSPDGKKYELIPEVEDLETVPEPDSKNAEKKIEKKHKSKKKKKKSKRSKQSIDDSDTEDKERSKKKKRKFSKERKKHRKKYSSSSSDSSDSSSSDDAKSHKRKHSDDHETRTKKCKHSKTKHS
ncbi:PREDICTED: nucleolar protein of 40 kDa-like [Trachymyrmex cornetzi]|uniref:Nucleolar protein of 40 kDa n=1 Tax=Trachymyrmex cornetzi TaxID=471704 RepID=A0A195EMW8_9HYME|nr:PREDICTED: nucleolar protein of 40 kDa-like [Trachymyrmex cornetzi]KYN29229.1 Nucleolar protein of 40 kDa [Trachymyrmex cornetzi]